MRISDWSSDVCSSDLLVALYGVRLTDDLKCGLPRPRWPPCATFTRWPSYVSSPISSSVPASKMRVPSGTRMSMSSPAAPVQFEPRSEEHTSELQSLMRISYAVFCLKQKNHKDLKNTDHQSLTNRSKVLQFQELQ